MILFNEKVEYEELQVQNPEQDDTTAVPQPANINTAEVSPITARPSSAPPSLTTTVGLLRYYLTLDDERTGRLPRRANSYPHVTEDTKPQNEKPATSMILVDPPPYESSRDYPASVPSEFSSEASSSKPPHHKRSPPPSPRNTLPRHQSSSSTSAAHSPPSSRSAALSPSTAQITPTHRLLSATPYSHLGNYNLSIYREQAGINGNYVLNTDIEQTELVSTSQNSKVSNSVSLYGLGTEPYIWLETKRGSIDARVSMAGGKRGLSRCSVVATAHNGDVKLAFNERSTDPDLHLHVRATSLQGGNVQVSLPATFVGRIRIIAPTSIMPFTSSVHFSPKLSTSAKLILISETVSNNIRKAEYFFGSPEAVADYFADLPMSNPQQKLWEGDIMELEVRTGKVMVYAHEEAMPDGWLTSCKKMVGRWFGFGSS